MPKRNQNTVIIRNFNVSDVARIAELERLCNPMPWSAADLHPYAEASNLQHIGRVAMLENTGEVVGYVCANHVEGEAEILVLGVAAEHRRSGIGRTLLMDLIEVLKAIGCRSIFLEVRYGNAPAGSLYHIYGFKETGIRKGYYSDTGEDARMMRRDFPG